MGDSIKKGMIQLHRKSACDDMIIKSRNENLITKMKGKRGSVSQKIDVAATKTVHFFEHWMMFSGDSLGSIFMKRDDIQSNNTYRCTNRAKITKISSRFQ